MQPPPTFQTTQLLLEAVNGEGHPRPGHLQLPVCTRNYCKLHLVPMSAVPHMEQGWKVGVGDGGRGENQLTEIKRAKKLRSGPMKQGLRWKGQLAKMKCRHTCTN